MKQSGIDIDVADRLSSEMLEEGASLVYLGSAGRLLGVIVLADPIKASTSEAIAALHGEA